MHPDFNVNFEATHLELSIVSSATLPFANSLGGNWVRFESRFATVKVLTMNLAAPMIVVTSFNDVLGESPEHLKSSPSVAAPHVQDVEVSATWGHLTSSRTSFCHCSWVNAQQESSARISNWKLLFRLKANGLNGFKLRLLKIWVVCGCIFNF